MQTHQIHIKGDYSEAATEPFVAMRPDLILVFGDTRFFADGTLGQRLRKQNPATIIVGCSTAGEMVNSAAVYQNTLVLTGVRFDGVQLHVSTTLLASADASRTSGEALGLELKKAGAASVFVIAPGHGINGSDLVAGLGAVLGDSVVTTGGLAGDGSRFQQTYTLFNETIEGNMIVALGFNGRIHVGYGSEGGWQAFGPDRLVTKAVSNVLYELDGRSALELYKEYLGDKAKDLPASGLLYPFSIVQKDTKNSSGLIRTILNVNEQDGSLTFAGDIPEGSTVRLMHSKTAALVDGAQQAGELALSTSQGGGSDSLAILVSCVGRKLVMGDDVDDEVAVVKAAFGPRAMIAGFYSYGEIGALGHGDKKTVLHNQTMTITYVRQV